ARSLPPGRPHLLTIEGENTVTFLPEVRPNPFRIDYRARVEYLVNTRSGVEAEAKGVGAVKKKTGRKTVGGADPVKRKRGGQTESNVAGAVDVVVHSAEMKFRQNGQTVVESRISRARFQGRFQPDAPVLSVSYNEAPPGLQELLKKFDTPAASVLLDDRSHVVGRRVRSEGPLHSIIET